MSLSSCRRCSPGFVSTFSLKTLVHALTLSGDFETILKAKLIASTSCPAFATISSVVVSFSPGSVVTKDEVVVPEEQHFSWGYTAHFEGLSASPDDPVCIEAFDVAFVEAWNEAHAGGDVVAEACTVDTTAPGSLGGLGGGNYHYNGGGDYRYVSGVSSLLLLVV